MPSPSRASRVSIAPMMGWTHTHFRTYMRMISPDFTLYSEMVVADKMAKHACFRELQFTEKQHPICLQLGGSNPKTLAQCTHKAWQLGFDAVNLNVGCPSKKVRSDHMGAALMKHPALVATCLQAMQEASPLPVSVKTRIGVDHYDDEEFFSDFIHQVTQNGHCKHVIVHARKAFLQGLSAKENRDIPPLNYERVRRVKKAFPHLSWHINGGIRSVDEVLSLLTDFDGVMLGRVAYEDPYTLFALQAALTGTACRPVRDVITAYLKYARAHIDVHGISPHYLLKPFLRVYTLRYDAQAWHAFVHDAVHNDIHYAIDTVCALIRYAHHQRNTQRASSNV